MVFVSSLLKTIVAILVVFACIVIVVYSGGVPLAKAIYGVCLVEFLVLLPISIFDFITKCRTIVYELHFDDKGMSVIYDYYFCKKTKYIVYDELSFSVKTMYSYFLQGTCVKLYENHKPIIFITCRPGWNEALMIEVIRTLLEAKNNNMERPLNTKLFSDKYFYTLGLEKSDIAQQLVHISNNMKEHK